MFLNSTLIFCLVFELKDALLGLRIAKILISPDQKELFFSLRGKSQRIGLYFSAQAQNCRIEMREEDVGDFQKTNLFWFAEGGYIQSFEQLDFDRVIKISCEKRTQFGAGETFDLIFELTGRNSNVILVKGDRRIIDCLRKIDTTRNRFREILPGSKYTPPPPAKKKNPFFIQRDEFHRLIEAGKRPILQTLISGFIGLDEFLSQKILIQSGIDPKKKATRLSQDQIEILWRSFSQTFEDISNHRVSFQIVVDQDGGPKAISCVNLPFITDSRKIHLESLNSAVRNFFSLKLDKEKLREETHRLSLMVRRTLKKLKKRRDKIEDDLKQAGRFEEYKRFGELLMMNKDKIKKGQTFVTLVDIFGSEHSEIEIPLDAKISPIGNAQRYFKKHKKAKEGLKIITRRESETKDKIADLEQISERLEKLGGEGDLEEIKHELIQLGFLSTQALGKDTRSSIQKTKQKQLQFRTFLADNGAEILVGRNNRENDFLTFKFARPDDLWFHAQDVPGSHVLLKRKNKKTEPTTEQIRQAARIAAYYSKARGEKKTSVVYTQAKYVRKPKKAKPGLALVEREKTVMVEPKLPDLA